MEAARSAPCSSASSDSTLERLFYLGHLQSSEIHLSRSSREETGYTAG